MVRLTTMIRQISGLHGTNDLTSWEQKFVGRILSSTREGKDTTTLTDRQVDAIERMYKKHFSG
jgi:hypothetical protein